MKQRRAVTGAAVIFISGCFRIVEPALAGCLDTPDHLEPPDSILAAFNHSYEYRVAVRATLLSDQSDRPYFRVVVLPSFFPEWTLSIEPPVAGEAKVAVVEARKQVYTAKGYRTPGTTTFASNIDGTVAEALHSVLEKALLDTRPCATLDGSSGYDGVTYQFLAFMRSRGVLSGETWSPRKDTRAGRMVLALGLLYRIARAGPDAEATLRQQLSEVVSDLKAEFSVQGS